MDYSTTTPDRVFVVILYFAFLMGKKRKSSEVTQTQAPKEVDEANKAAGPSTSRKKIRKLAPPRPFPTVPTSVSATGPPSAHKEGKNFICITRRTPLGVYLRRCKDIIVKDGWVKFILDNYCVSCLTLCWQVQNSALTCPRCSHSTSTSLGNISSTRSPI